MKSKIVNLYHYTSFDSFCSIAESGEIFATNSLYLNDEKEIKYTIDLVENRIEKAIMLHENNALKNETELNAERLRALLSDMSRLKRILNKINKYVCSFSEEGDLLSQWRGYSSNGGVSFAFTKSYLQDLTMIHGLTLVKCVYNKALQTRRINELINEYLSECEEIGTSLKNNLDEVSIGFLKKILEISITYKDESFKEEQEWRIVSDSAGIEEFGLSFRAGKNAIIPYTKIPISIDDKIELSEIILGPTVKTDLSVASMEMLLKAKDIKYQGVKVSKIPYRDW